MTNPVKERRFGTFRVSVGIITVSDSELLRVMFDGLTVVSAERDYVSDTIHYVAACAEFEVVSEGQMATPYELVLSARNDKDPVSGDVVATYSRRWEVKL